MRALVLILSWVAGAYAGPDDAVRVLALRPVAETFPADGVVEAVRQATVSAQVAGRIVAMKVDVGQMVRQGDVLARIDAREAGEEVAAAHARVQEAAAALARAERLLVQRFLSQAALDRARSEHEAASAALARAQAGASHAVLRAPISGVVAERMAQAGDLAVPGRPLLTLLAPDGLRVSAAVPQARIGTLRSDAPAEIEIPGQEGRLSGGTITVLPQADGATHTVPVRVSLPAAARVLPGQYARVHFQIGVVPRMTVPLGAIVRRGEMSAVYVDTGEPRPRLRQVRLGLSFAGGEVEVLAGAVAGERVHVDAAQAALQAHPSAQAKP